MTIKKLNAWLDKKVNKSSLEPKKEPKESIFQQKSLAKPQVETPAVKPTKKPFFKKNKPPVKNNSGKNFNKNSAKPLAKPNVNTQVNTQNKSKANHPKFVSKGIKLKVMPLGGLEEVGKNMMVIEYQDDIIVIDAGMQFPEEDMLGIDYVIPDISYLEKNKHKIRGIVITHGHLDHIGALPHILPKLNFPQVYGTPLTMGLSTKRLEEFALQKQARLNNITAEDKFKLGVFNLEFFRVNHSIPDGLGIFINTPVGNLVHTGDFKFDFTPADDKPADFARIAELGSRGVLAAFVDSTNATKPGYALSEKVIGENLENIITHTSGRIVIASFSSLIGRIQQIIDICVKTNRKMFISGRSMEVNLAIAEKLGYIKAPKGLMNKVTSKVLDHTPANQTLILTTGSQGESMSALSRIALGEHSRIQVNKGDTVLLSSSPIIGNEKAIVTVINNLSRLGAKVITNSSMDIHTSGHAQQEDLKLMHSLIKPKHLVPIHGELHMRVAHKDVGLSLGRDENTIHLMDNGDILEFDNLGNAQKAKEKLNVYDIMVDGLGVGDIGTQVIRERQIMSQNGIIVVLLNVDKKTQKLLEEPNIVSRGFVYMKESQKLYDEIKKMTFNDYTEIIKKNPKIKRKDLKNEIRLRITRFVRKRIDRQPMILPLII